MLYRAEMHMYTFCHNVELVGIVVLPVWILVDTTCRFSCETLTAGDYPPRVNQRNALPET